MATSPLPDQPYTSGSAEQQFIASEATRLGLDPEAVLAVAAHEGITLPAQVGDSGTSFGPWQLHVGGALPANIWNQGAGYSQGWANSQTGIDYALGRIATVAQGQTGLEAITSIVNQFERPSNPAAEITASWATYRAGGGPSTGGGGSFLGGIAGDLNPIPAIQGVGGAVGGLAHDVAAPFETAKDTFQLLQRVFSFIFSYRFLEIVGGGLLVLLGLYILSRQLGVNVSAPAPAKAAAKAAGA